MRDARRLHAGARGDQLTLGGDRHQDRLVHAARLGVRPTAMISALALDRNHRDTGMPCQYREVARSLNTRVRTSGLHEARIDGKSEVPPSRSNWKKLLAPSHRTTALAEHRQLRRC